MVIKVLGTGCANCTKLEQRAKQAVEQMGIEAEIIKVDDIQEIMAYGVMSTPALVVDEELRVAGRVPEVDDIVRLLSR